MIIRFLNGRNRISHILREERIPSRQVYQQECDQDGSLPERLVSAPVATGAGLATGVG